MPDIEQLRGRNALVTGASGGIGRWIALAMAREGMNVAVCARREEALSGVVKELRERGVTADLVGADLSHADGMASVIERAQAAVGPLDVLVNNAGVEIAAGFTRYTAEELTATIGLNLTAPMLLTQAVLPGMLERGRGHVVFMSSLAGKLGPAYEAPYGASKAGLIGLCQALRSEYARSPVGFSVVCPGFVAGDGMYQRMVEGGVRSNRLLGSTTVEKVVEKVLHAIKHDVPEVVETGAPVRPLLAVNQLAPSIGYWAVGRFGATALFRRHAELEGRA